MESRSTGTCLTEFLLNIYSEIDGGSAVGVLFLDLVKAFDSILYLIPFNTWTPSVCVLCE